MKKDLGMIVIVGKSGSGKTSIAHKLKEFGYEMLITDTTRPIREGEVDGKDYHFRSLEEFSKLEDRGYYAETVSFNAAFGFCKYGSKKEYYTGNNNGKVIILNAYGLKEVEKIKDKKYTSYYLKVDDDVLLDRLNKRGDSKEEVNRRLITDRKDLEGIENIVNFTIDIGKNDSIDDITKKIIEHQKKS